MVVSSIDYKLENNIIVLDPGHATKADLSKEPIGPGASTTKYKQTGGAYGAFTNTPEYLVNMQVAQKLKVYLEQKGFIVVMTKTDNSTVMANSERAKIGNDAGAALVIRIHADGSNDQSVKGASMLIPANNQYCSSFYSESKAYGKFLLDAMCSQVGIKNRGLIERDDISGFNWSSVPVVLVEMGFMSNKEEDYLLKSDEYQDKIARALANGIEAIGVK
jgi:N-acetylmuramoyl-L-alanine amidase